MDEETRIKLFEYLDRIRKLKAQILFDEDLGDFEKSIAYSPAEMHFLTVISYLEIAAYTLKLAIFEAERKES